MEQLSTVVFCVGVIAYSSASTLFFLELLRWEGSPLRAQWAARLLGVGAVFHALHALLASSVSSASPFQSLRYGLGLSALMAIASYFVLRRRRRGFHIVGVAVAPLALALLLGSQFVSHEAAPARSLPRALLALHVAANFVGVGLFLTAGASGAFYLAIERKLKEKRKGLVPGLPPLDQLDRTNHRLLLVGFPLLTFGVVTGAFFSPRLFDADGLELFRLLFGYATWLLLAAVLVLRHVAGWRGRRAAYGTLAGVACVLVVILMYAVRVYAGTA